MTRVNTNRTALQGGARRTEPEAKRKPPTVKQSLASVLHKLDNTHKKANQLSNEKVSEDEAIFGIVCNRLARTDGKEATSFLKTTTRMAKQLMAKGDSHAVFKAVDAGVKKLVEAGKISLERGERIMRYAAGKGNLWKTVEELRSTSVSLKGSGTNIEKVMTKIQGNSMATEEQLKQLRINAGITETSTSGQVTPPAIVNAGEVTTPLPTSASIETKPNELAYYPESKERGMAAVYIPARYLQQVDRVTLVKADGSTIELDGSMVGADGRRHFHADTKGAVIGDNFRIVVHFLDNTQIVKTIAEGGDFSKWPYGDN